MIRQSLVAALWAGAIALDITAFGPWLISQPLVAGPLFGWLTGHIAIGLIVGGIVQLLWMDVTPVGVGIPYDATAVTILAVFWAGSAPYPSLSQVALALALAVPFGFVFKQMDQTARRFNVRIVRRIESASDARLGHALAAGIGIGLLWNFLRYTGLYFVVMVSGAWLWKTVAYFPKDMPLDHALTMAMVLLPVVGLGVCIDLFMSEQPDASWLARLGFKRK